ncbi:biogenesis of lysosome-related organelles complex 1 subunit 6 isoform X2 [Drosophila willistoni]|uniref:biogenesis of lysosome-related organelles complex 1 subunit 6 isoform X2 n=1 Tax=Drosophila willistoni TaxID=7260 RepID=UPI001F082F7C|nr:biogenesis of lysosome-related organelles complex 1 subunit 6 isoform X2 [Drosophila willistoni]
MLKSSNLNSIINELTISDGEREMETQQEQQPHPVKTPSDPQPATTTTSTNNAGASSQLSAGILAIAEPPLDRVRGQLKELIGRQNKIYIDLSKEKYKLDCSEVAKLNDMVNL